MSGTGSVLIKSDTVERLEQLLEYIDMNVHFETINSLSQEQQFTYHKTLNMFSTLIRDLRRHDHTAEFNAENTEIIPQSAEDIVGYIKTLEIGIMDIDKDYRYSLPGTLVVDVLNMINQFGFLTEKLEEEL